MWDNHIILLSAEHKKSFLNVGDQYIPNVLNASSLGLLEELFVSSKKHIINGINFQFHMLCRTSNQETTTTNTWLWDVVLDQLIWNTKGFEESITDIRSYTSLLALKDAGMLTT